MRAHIVVAHPEPQSFNAHLAREAGSLLSVTVGASRAPTRTMGAAATFR